MRDATTKAMRNLDDDARQTAEALVESCVRVANGDKHKLASLLAATGARSMESYADAAAVLGASYYDACRTMVEGEPLGAEPRSHYYGGLRDHSREAFAGAIDAFVYSNNGINEEELKRLVSDRFSYELRVAHSYCMTQAGAQDDKKPRYARVPTGSETCPFCLTLASRGAAYTTAQSAGESTHFHANCDCLVTPSWKYARKYAHQRAAVTLDDERALKRGGVWDTSEIEGYSPYASGDKARSICLDTLKKRELDDLAVEYGLDKDAIASAAMASMIDLNSGVQLKRLMESMYVGDFLITDDSSISSFEKNAVTHAINNLFDVKYKSQPVGHLPYGDFVYTFVVNEFNEYDFIEKEPIDGL